MSVESIYWYWIYPTKNWGNCVIWRISVHLLGAGLGKVYFVIYIYICSGYILPTFGVYASFGGFLCALWAQGFVTYIYLY